VSAVCDIPGTLLYPAVEGERTLTIGDVWKIPRVGAPVPAPGGGCVVPVTEHRDEERRSCTRLWLVPPGGGEPRALTSDDATAGAPVFSPDGRRLAFTRRAAGDDAALAQLYVMRLDGGEPECVTDLPMGVADARWRADGSGLVVATKLIRAHATIEATRIEIERRRDDPVKVHATEARVYRYWDRWLTDDATTHLVDVDLETGACRDLAPDFTGWFDFMDPTGQFDVAPDGSEVVFAAIVFNDDRNEIESRVFRVPTAGGEAECLTPDIEGGAFRPRYASGGASIVYGRTEDRYFYADRRRIYRWHRATGEHEPWCDGWDASPQQWDLAADGTLVFAAEQAGRTNLYALDPGAAEPRRLADGGTITAPRVGDDGHVYCIAQTIGLPPEVHAIRWTGDAHVGAPRDRLTRFTQEAMAGVALGEVREMNVTGAEGESVQAYLVLPPGHDPARPAPLVNIVHGGPHGINGDDFHFRWNVHLFAAPGYVVVTPNFQGSTSWGTDFARRIQGDWADRPFRDVMAVADAVVESGLVDPDRTAAIGASYGGYMMAWIAGHTDRFKCIVNHAGVYNTLSMYATDGTQGRARAFGGEPWDGLDAIDRVNPARFTADMVTPMLVSHGEKDYRVPVTQGLELYGVLKAKGVPARLLYFPDEGHWVLKPHNSIRWYSEVLGWLDRWLEIA